MKRQTRSSLPVMGSPTSSSRRKSPRSPASLSPRPQRRPSHSPRASARPHHDQPEAVVARPHSPPIEHESFEGDAALAIRRSSRKRKLNYACMGTDWMVHEDVILQRQILEDGREALAREAREARTRGPPSETGEPSAGEAATGRGDSPFFRHHVQFSPSAKTASPFRGRRRLRRVQLHNLTSEDEQSEFQRRFSRDLRSRRSKAAGRQRYHEPLSSEDDEDDHEAQIPAQPPRAAQRTRDPPPSPPLDQPGDEAALVEENEDLAMDEASHLEPPPPENRQRRSLRQRNQMVNGHHATPSSSESEASDGEAPVAQPKEPVAINLRNGRPMRSRVPVDRFQYEVPQTSRSSARRGSQELRNLDQYSSDEEFRGGSDPGGRRRKRRYNMRENRPAIQRFEEEYVERTPRPNNVLRRTNSVPSSTARSLRPTTKRANQDMVRYRDTSSSSSEDDKTDEDKFQKRKSKRMNIERAKLLPLNLGKDDVAKAIFRERQKVGASLADVSPMEMDMGVTFDNIGGLESHINSLKEMVVFPLLYPEVFKNFSLAPPRGVLFYGPPGTGKTLVARALASECSQDGRKVAFFMRKGADCLSKWIGESERQLRLLFDQAYLMRPSIIFFDEIDGLAPVRSSRQDQIHSSIVSTLLALMDGLDNRGEIIIIGATNRIENIDPALRRPGRFDRELRFGLPTRDARREILNLHTKTWIPKVPHPLLDVLADESIGYCGADLKGLCAETALLALRRRYPQVYKSNKKLAIDVDKIQVEERDFKNAMKHMVPSTHRVQDQHQSPIPKDLRPLLNSTVNDLWTRVQSIFPCVSKSDQVSSFHFRPRLLITGRSGQGLTTYICPAVLHFLEKLPCHKLDIPALYSNSARSPEEALLHVVHEAKRTVPSVLYLPHFERLWRIMTESVRETFLSVVSDIPPTASLLFLASAEAIKFDDDLEEEFDRLFRRGRKEIFDCQNPETEARQAYFAPIFEAALAPVKVNLAEMVTEELEVLPAEETRKLTDREQRKIQKKEQTKLRELRIFLREIWTKLNRDQKFFMFRIPVDTEEVYDYLEVVKNPMDFDQMLNKLDNGEYFCAQDFLDDIDLIAENALAYNTDLNYETNKIICHRAKALQDFAYALIKAEMDSDFEEECHEIKLKKTDETTVDENGDQLEKAEKEGEISINGSHKKKKARKKTSNWAKGVDHHARKKRKRAESDLEEQDPENEDSVTNGINGDSPHANGILHLGGDGQSTPKSPRSVNGHSRSGSPSKSPPSPPKTGEPSGAIKINHSKLDNVQLELTQVTEGFVVEELERAFAILMETVTSFSQTEDREALVHVLEKHVIGLKK